MKIPLSLRPPHHIPPGTRIFVPSEILDSVYTRKSKVTDQSKIYDSIKESMGGNFGEDFSKV